MFGRVWRAREISQMLDYVFVKKVYVSAIAIRHGEPRSTEKEGWKSLLIHVLSIKPAFR